ncbi:MAG: endonuclease V [Ahrensia sp.]|nr:endonuclease V [Ahrensia sp.]
MTTSPLNLAVDVHYREDGSAVAAGILFPDWETDEIARETVVTIPSVSAYVPGRFFERELPCLLALIETLDTTPSIIVIDGYVTLGPDERPGLGAHLFEALDRKIAIIGVAKNRFRDTPVSAELLRGRSARPLYVTSVGIEPDEAKRLVASMRGTGRIPSLLAAADRLSRAPAP